MDVVALLGAHLQRVAEPLGRQEADPATASLDDRVRDKRRPVHDMAYRRERYRDPRQQIRHALQRADGGVRGSRQAFVQVNPALLGVHQHEVREGAADIETHSIAFPGHVLPAAQFR